MQLFFDGFASNPIFIVCTDENSMIQDMTAYSAQLLGTTGPALLGKSISSVKGSLKDFINDWQQKDFLLLENNESIRYINITTFCDQKSHCFLISKDIKKQANKTTIHTTAIELTKSQLSDTAKIVSERNQKLHFKKPPFSSVNLDHNDHGSLFSNREQQYLYYLLRGKSNKNIAELLGIPSCSARVYYQRIKAKTQCQSRGHLLEMAIARGWTYSIPTGN